MKAFHLLMLLTYASAGMAQTRIDLQNQGQNVNFLSASSTRPVRTGASLPSTCLTHELFLKSVTDGRALLYVCGQDGAWGGVGEATSTVTATATSTLPATAKVLLLSAASAITLTTTPQMSTGVDGQRVLLANVGSNSITLQDQAVLSGSGMNFGGANLPIAAGASVELIYMASQGYWRQAGCANCTTTDASLTLNRLLVGASNRVITASPGVLNSSGALSGLSSVQVGDGTEAGETRVYEIAANGGDYRSWMAPSDLSSTLRLQFADQIPTADQTLTVSAPDNDGISAVSFSNRLADPGANGLVKRTAVNTTAAATAGTDYYAPGVAVASADLPNPTTTAGGKVKAVTCSSGYYVSTIGTDGTPACTAGTVGTGGGTVTSVGLALPNEFSVSGTPITGSGTLTGAWASQSANRVLASPSGASGAPSFRALVAADLPAHAHTSTSTGGTLDAAAIASGTIATARLGSGTASASTYLRGDGAWATPSSSGGGGVGEYAWAIGSTTIGSGSTSYLAYAIASVNSPESYRQWLAHAGTVTAMYVQTTGTQSSTGALTLTLRQNSADTAAAVTVAAGSTAGLYSVTGLSISLSDNDLLSVKVANAATAASAGIASIRVVVQ